MQKVIGLCGFKRTGKDHVARIIKNKKDSSYEIFSIADNVKVSSAKDRKFLDIDDKFIDEATVITVEMNKLKKLRKTKYMHSTASMSDKDILEKVNEYKNYEILGTREGLYKCFDEEKPNGYEHIALEMVNHISKKEKEWKDVIITDARTLLEAVDILLEDGLLINIFNCRSESLEQVSLLHFSEYELAKKIDGKRIGLSIDVTSRDQVYLSNTISEFIDMFYKNFNGYSSSFIGKLVSIQEYLLEEMQEMEAKTTISYKKGFEAVHRSNLERIDPIRRELQEAIEEEYRQILKF